MNFKIKIDFWGKYFIGILYFSMYCKGSMNHDHEGLYDSVNKIMIEGSSQSSLDEVDEAMLNQLEDQYESNSNRFKDSNRI